VDNAPLSPKYNRISAIVVEEGCRPTFFGFGVDTGPALVFNEGLLRGADASPPLMGTALSFSLENLAGSARGFRRLESLGLQPGRSVFLRSLTSSYEERETQAADPGWSFDRKIVVTVPRYLDDLCFSSHHHDARRRLVRRRVSV
jgi:hypothetical protein